MRIGSISQGKTKCEACGKTIAYAERYLIIKETGGKEDDANGKPRRYCAECAIKKGYASTRLEKGERVVTFFQDMINPVVALEEGEAEGEAAIEPAAAAEKKEDE